MNKRTLELAMSWFTESNIDAYEDDGTMYIILLGSDTHVQISNAEIEYRAELKSQEKE